MTRGSTLHVASDASDGHFASDGHPKNPLWIRIGSELRTVVVCSRGQSTTDLAHSIKNVSSEHRQVLDIHPPAKFACGVPGLDLGEQGTPQHL